MTSMQDVHLLYGSVYERALANGKAESIFGSAARKQSRGVRPDILLFSCRSLSIRILPPTSP